MTTTCQFIVDRAKGFNTLNTPLASDIAEMLTRIRSIQQRAFTSVAHLTRDRFKTTTSLTSSSGSSGRTLDLAPAMPIAPPIERILQVKLADGREVNPVDELDIEAELAPRYFVRGTKLYEVGNDWSTASGTISATVLYVYGQTAIDVAGALSQLITVPDEHIDVLIVPLAMYLHQKDPGRDPIEYDRLVSDYQDAWKIFLDYLTNYGGLTAQRFQLPAPPELPKR